MSDTLIENIKKQIIKNNLEKLTNSSNCILDDLDTLNKMLDHFYKELFLDLADYRFDLEVLLEEKEEDYDKIVELYRSCVDTLQAIQYKGILQFSSLLVCGTALYFYVSDLNEDIDLYGLPFETLITKLFISEDLETLPSYLIYPDQHKNLID